ncbi:MAG: hypothetical protein IJ194_07730 [Bacilli bacterium]|nr:hypothetical protein [Bacilli bacterium]
MKFIKLKIDNGLFLEGVEDEYSASSNLLFSKKNSVGKSTYLRILFHAFGYSIPDMYGMKFQSLVTELTVEESGNDYFIRREPNNISVKVGEEITNYSLPSEHVLFLSQLFKKDNLNVLSNLLGLMYVDQEKGWTLLNRGIVIGKNRFDIDKLLIGLGEIDCDKELTLKDKLEKENKKCRSLIDVNDLKQSILEDNEVIEFRDFELEIKRKIDYLNLRINDLKDDIKRVDSVIKKNSGLFNYLTSMHLVVVSKSGEEVPVNQNTLRDARDTNNLLISRKNVLSLQLKKLESELEECRHELDDYYLRNNTIFNLPGESDKKVTPFLFKSIANLDIDLPELQNIIDENVKQINQLRKLITLKIARNAELNKNIFSKLYSYCDELGISSKVINDPKFLYTDKLKYYSGTDFHKLVIAFKVALHKATEKYLGTTLPFVLDSPSGRELNDDNIKLTIDFVRRELTNSQIFFASIKEIDCEKILYFHGVAIENHSVSFADNE